MDADTPDMRRSLLAGRLGYFPPYPPSSAVYKLFGDLHSAHRACGYDGPRTRTRFDPDEALGALRSFHDAHGHNPTVRDWDKLKQRPSSPSIIRHFGSWNAALSAAELTVTQPRRRWRDDQILAAIRTFDAQQGRPPSAADFGGTAMPGYETVRVRFGSLPATIDRARATQPVDSRPT
jgi:hypothetical protein